LVALARRKAAARSGKHELYAGARATVLKALSLAHSAGITALREHWVLHARAAGSAGAPASAAAQQALSSYGDVVDTLCAGFGIFVANAPSESLVAGSKHATWLLAAEAAALQDATHLMGVPADTDAISPPDLRLVYVPQVLRLALSCFPDIAKDLPHLQRAGLAHNMQHALDDLQAQVSELGRAQEELALRRALLQQRLERNGQAAAAAVSIDEGRLARLHSRLGTLREDLAQAGRQEHAALRRIAQTVDGEMVQRGVAECHSGASGTRLPEAALYHRPNKWGRTPDGLKAVLLAEIEGLKAAGRDVRSQQHAVRLGNICRSR
jgi:hypothetical protein